MMRPKVSVVMASYNHAPYVREAVTSVLTQSFQDFELVITDDGSRDGTVEVIHRVEDPRIRLHVFLENQGACVAINDAIGRALGEYIAVLNSDDYFLPDKLRRQVDYLDAHPEFGAVFGLPQFVDAAGHAMSDSEHTFKNLFSGQNRRRHEWLRQFFYDQNSLCHPTVMLRRSCYEKVGLFDPLLMQLPDLDMWVRLCGSYEIHILAEQLTAFRVLKNERNVSAPTLAKIARHAWETISVLDRYAALSEAELREIFGRKETNDQMQDMHVMLAREAIKLGRPGYVQFGLKLLRNCINKDIKSFSPVDYFKLVGEVDPCAVRFFAQEYEFLAKSRFWQKLKRCIGWDSSIR